MTNRLIFASLVALTVSVSAWAADTTYETLLVPIVLGHPVAGAYGSLWTSELRVHASSIPVRFKQFDRCLACLPEYVVPADTTTELDIGFDPTVFPPGRLVYVSRDTVQSAVFNLRIKDLSREALTWGTELPVVRESQFRTTTLTLINIPTDTRFRAALRVYDVDAQPDTIFHIDVFDDTSGALLQSGDFHVRPNGESSPDRIPSIVELTDLRAAFPATAAAQRIRVAVTPLGASRFWAFASVTNNETQHVTVITP